MDTELVAVKEVPTAVVTAVAVAATTLVTVMLMVAVLLSVAGVVVATHTIEVTTAPLLSTKQTLDMVEALFMGGLVVVAVMVSQKGVTVGKAAMVVMEMVLPAAVAVATFQENLVEMAAMVVTEQSC